MLAEKYIVLDEAVYDSLYPDDLKILKLLPEDDDEFAGHIPNHLVYPDYAVSKIINQGIRLLIKLLYPELKGIPVGMVEHIKLRGQLYPGDHISVLIKRWQERSRVAKFEIGIENQDGKLVYESTVLGTVVDEI